MHQLTDEHCDPTMWGHTADDEGLEDAGLGGYPGISR
jgi:hypothetical protein